MVDKKVWHGIHSTSLTAAERKAVIRTSMFLKDKYMASGAFDKLTARLVTGGDQQDKEIYDNLSSSTAFTTSVLIVASIVTREGKIGCGHVCTLGVISLMLILQERVSKYT